MKVFTGITICALTIALWPFGAIAQTTTASGAYALDVVSGDLVEGEYVTVIWDAPNDPNNNDWVGLYKVGSGDKSYVEYEYVISDEPEMEFLIGEAGEYEFRYFTTNSYNKAATSESFTVAPGTQVFDDFDDDNDEDVFDFDGDDNGTTSDDDDVNDDESFDQDNDSTGDVVLDVSATEIGTGQSITVTWSGNPSSNSDWIGLYRVGATDRSYISYQYVGNRNELTFTPRVAGEYELRYYPNNSYNLAATSDTITVGSGGSNPPPSNGDYEITIDETEVDAGDTITVTWQTPSTPGSRDWIGLYRVGSDDRSYLAYQYVDLRDNEVTFTLSTTGEYELRYFTNNGYSRQTTSETITVGNPEPGSGNGNGSGGYSVEPDQLTYSVGDIARVTWEAPDSGLFDWIGLYRVGASDNDYTSYEYTDIFSNVETFNLRSSGTYEFRYFTRNSYNKVATSPTFTVGSTNGGGGSGIACSYDTDDITNIPTGSGPIIAFGDSLTYGTGASNGQNYVDELERRLNVNIINEGVRGNSTEDALARLESDVLSRDPSAVIVFLGGNDEIRRAYEELSDNAAERELQDELDELARDRFNYDWESKRLLTEAQTLNNIETIIERIQDEGAAVILVGFDAPFFNNDFNEDLEEIAEDTNSIFVSDIYSGVFGRPAYMDDLVHPNNSGYDIFASRIAPAVACVIE